MKNFLLCADDGCLTVVLHALPGCNDPKMEFQWYLKDNINDPNPVKLEGDIWESFVLMLTNKEGNCARFKGKYVYCHYQTGDISCDTESVFITDNLYQLISRNQFYEISFYGEDGMIRQDISYHMPAFVEDEE